MDCFVSRDFERPNIEHAKAAARGENFIAQLASRQRVIENPQCAVQGLGMLVKPTELAGGLRAKQNNEAGGKRNPSEKSDNQRDDLSPRVLWREGRRQCAQNERDEKAQIKAAVKTIPSVELRVNLRVRHGMKRMELHMSSKMERRFRC